MAKPRDLLAHLQADLQTLEIDALLVPRADRYQGEEVLACDERLAAVTGFSGSAGSLLITANAAVLFVDGRYTTQAPRQVKPRPIEVINSGDLSLAAWLAKRPELSRIGVDPWLMTLQQADSLKAALGDGQSLVALDENPVDRRWRSRPAAQKARVRHHPLAVAGKSTADKIADIHATIPGGHALFVGLPEQVSWLLNVRSDALETTPSALSYAVLQADGRVDWILHEDSARSAASLKLPQVSVTRDAVKVLGQLRTPLLLDASTTPWAIELALAALPQPVATRRYSSPIAMMQACKNAAELAGMREAHEIDGAVMVEFMAWLDTQLPGFLDEYQAADMVDSMRRAHGATSLAFATISASGPNAALPHYRATADSARPSEAGEVYLVDSGGQYAMGTTDITRVTLMGAATAEQKRLYTLVLQGHLALMRARFPEGTTGQALDLMARLPLWQAGLDYDHGTGHGVGAVLSVHEGPQRIGKPVQGAALVALQPGMVVSVEPGYYRPGELGIRIENLAIVQPMARPGDERPMLGFENLTWCPYERALIDLGLLTDEERQQVNDYHRQTLAVLQGRLSAPDRAWLELACRPL
jgi:Xaa-Pro aminopeptidase